MQVRVLLACKIGCTALLVKLPGGLISLDPRSWLIFWYMVYFLLHKSEFGLLEYETSESPLLDYHIFVSNRLLTGILRNDICTNIFFSCFTSRFDFFISTASLWLETIIALKNQRKSSYYAFEKWMVKFEISQKIKWHNFVLSIWYEVGKVMCQIYSRL